MSQTMASSDAPLVADFRSVDGSGRTDQLIAILDRLEQTPAAMQLREHSYDLLRAHPGDSVVDAGCGTGLAVAEMRARGLVASGVDSSEDMIAEAHNRFPEVTFQQASAEVLPFAPGSLRGYRAERLYGHLPEPRLALAEAHRVLAPGGRIVLLDVENDLRIVDSDDRQLTAALIRAFADSVPNPWVGRSARSLLVDTGFAHIEIEIHPRILTSYSAYFIEPIPRAALAVGACTPARATTWLDEQRQRGETGRFFAAHFVYVVSATRA